LAYKASEEFAQRLAQGQSFLTTVMEQEILDLLKG